MAGADIIISKQTTAQAGLSPCHCVRKITAASIMSVNLSLSVMRLHELC